MTPEGNPNKLRVETESLASEGSESRNSASPLNASCSVPTRTIVNELQVNVDFCVIYGQNNHPQNGTWVRSAEVEWTAYPGYPSVQNRTRVISSYASSGDVWLWGTVTVQKQNGIFAPTDLNSAVFEARNGEPVFGWTLSGISSYGSHAERMVNLEVTDMDYQFWAKVSDPVVFTPRFHCEPTQSRCFYPSGQEAGL